MKDIPIQDWVKLAVSHAKDIWMAADRAHDASLITLVTMYISDHDTIGLNIYL